jgi:enamine deaminase RidA (YjgF/YER057c/UK114 family)
MLEKIPINPESLPEPRASFNRALKLSLGSAKLLFISGTASVGPQLQTMYPDDFTAQVKHAYNNIKQILINQNTNQQWI